MKGLTMEIKLFNNLTRQKEVFKPITPNELKFYSCGPTTYDFLHVGNARALVVGDLIHRIFKSLDYKVTFVRNYTDVDDKIIDRAKQLNVSALTHADRFVKECEADMNSLVMLPATFTPKVSETMPEIIKMIEDLIKNGFGYVVDGEVLYNVPKFSDYGKLSKVKLDSLQHGIRVEVEGHKKHPSDFVLWKPAKPDEVFWESPWGKGRPGWHIECSAMAKKFLGDSIDLHHGGVDLQFPHHENEIAQSEAANSCEFCHHWAHNEFLNFGTEKMSKSLGNVVTIRKFVEQYSGVVLRHLLLAVHYRSKLDWTDEAITKAIGEVERIHEFALLVETQIPIVINDEDETKKITIALSEIKNELANDFNVPGAMGIFFGVIKDFNRLSKLGVSKNYIETLNVLIQFMKVATGLIHNHPQKILDELNIARKNMSGTDSGIEGEIEKLLADRKEARISKNWARSDEIRNRLNEMGIVVKDNPDGSVTWSYR
jgi:cysteinyl-tRNA synthetase